MLRPEYRLAIYMEGAVGQPFGKMGNGLLRYSRNPIVALVDSASAGQDARELTGVNRECPIVGSLREARSMGADVLVLGIAPPGGAIPAEWMPMLGEAVALGFSLVNGLHDLLAPRFPHLATGQFVWDVRQEPKGLTVGTCAAAALGNRRVLMIGTDMAVGKMSAGLEILRAAKAKDVRAAFVATGQIGIVITGGGVALDAVRVDFASGAIEREMLRTSDADLVIVEGQGALIHPASTANLPLLRGSCPTHLVLCHRAGQETLMRVPTVRIPPLRDYVALYQDLAEAVGTFPRPAFASVALNTARFVSDDEARDACAHIAAEAGVPCDDPVRFGGSSLLESLGV